MGLAQVWMLWKLYQCYKIDSFYWLYCCDWFSSWMAVFMGKWTWSVMMPKFRHKHVNVTYVYMLCTWKYVMQAWMFENKIWSMCIRLSSIYIHKYMSIWTIKENKGQNDISSLGGSYFAPSLWRQLNYEIPLPRRHVPNEIPPN